MPLPLITVQTFNQSSLQAAGAVFVQRVESVSVSRGLLAGITGAPSGTGRNELMEKKMNDLTQVLLSELDIQAKKKYPAAIGLVNADIDFTISSQDASMMLIGKASATVLVKRTKPLVSSGTMPEPMSRPMSEPMPRPMSEPMPMSAPRLDPMSRPMSEPRLDPMKGGKQRTFISKRLIKSSRKNRK